MNLDGLPRYIKLGYKDKDWYSECQNLFETVYGKERIKMISTLFAATSINSSLKSNIKLFRKALHEIENDKPFSNYLPVMLMQLERIRKGEEISGRKILSFSRAMSGDVNAVVVDIWLLRAFGEDRQYKRKLSGRAQSGGATKRQYDEIESFVREEANRMGIEARQLSAIIWSGVRTHFTGDRETHYKTILKHQLFNMFDLENKR